jgi:hypothetical protein
MNLMGLTNNAAGDLTQVKDGYCQNKQRFKNKIKIWSFNNECQENFERKHRKRECCKSI